MFTIWEFIFHDDEWNALMSVNEVLSQSHFDFWRIKLYLSTPEFIFLSDNKNHRKNPPLLRIEKEKKEICEMLFWYMFGFAEGLRSTGKIYKFYFYFIYEAFSAEHFLSFHPLISDLFPQGILTPNSSENTRNNISNLNITHETKQQKRILRSTNIGISHIHVECQMGRYERESSI